MHSGKTIVSWTLLAPLVPYSFVEAGDHDSRVTSPVWRRIVAWSDLPSCSMRRSHLASPTRRLAIVCSCRKSGRHLPSSRIERLCASNVMPRHASISKYTEPAAQECGEQATG